MDGFGPAGQDIQRFADVDYRNAMSKQVDGTGGWLFKAPKFIAWRDSPLSTPILWLYGSPGSGKTVLSAAVISHLAHRCDGSEPRKLVAYFFFNFNDERKQKLDDFLETIRHTLYTQLGLEPGSDLKAQGHAEACESMMETLARENATAYLVIDALDECSIDDRHILLRLFARLMGHSPQVPRWRIFVTSRMNVDIQHEMERLHAAQVHMAQKEVRRDIRNFIISELERDPRFDHRAIRLKKDLVDSFLERSDGSFLYATLILRHMGQTLPITASIESLLKSTPDTLSMLYTLLLLNIEAKAKKFVIPALLWLTASARPLSVAALATAVRFKPDSEGSNGSDDEPSVEEAEMARLFNGLVNVVDNTVLLVHASLAEFLRVIPEQPNGPVSEFAVDEVGAQRLLATTCLQYIAYYARSAKRCGSSRDLETFPLLGYACRFWMDHTRRWAVLSRDSDSALAGPSAELVASMLWDAAVVPAWTSVFNPEEPGSPPFADHQAELSSPVYYAVTTGIPEAVAHLASAGADISSPGGGGMYPLQAAVEEEHKEMVLTLLEHGASTTVVDSEGRMPLLEAALGGRTALTALLLRHTVPSKIIKHYPLEDGTCISIPHRVAAAATGPIFSFFLRPRPDRVGVTEAHVQSFLAARDAELLSTPLHHAVKSGNISVVSVIVHEGANVNAQDRDGNTALHLAALFNHERAWNLLIDHGALIDVENASHLTALGVTWDRRRLDWASYEVDLVLSRGMQENTKVLVKKTDSGGPDTPQHIFEKRYDLSGHSLEDMNEVKKALGRENSIFQRLHHPYIVSYLGCVDIDKETPRLYLEYCNGGDLRRDMRPPTPPPTPVALPLPMPIGTFMAFSPRNNRPAQPPSSRAGEPLKLRRWTKPQTWRLIYQLFSALAHLHYGVSFSDETTGDVYARSWDPAIHRDINPRNVVLSKRLDGEWDAKICDLGIARDEIKERMTRGKFRGSDHYQPPELGDERQWSPKGDVWALAKTIHGLRKGFAPVTDDAMKNLLDECRDRQPDARPSSLAVLEVAHRHVDTKFPSLEEELKLAGPNSLIFHAFETVVKQLDDIVPFVTEAAVDKRGVQMRRLSFLLYDGAMDEFIKKCRQLQLAVLFGEYAMALKEHLDAAEPQSPPPPVRGDMLEMLLRQDQNPDEQWPKSRWTALHIAAQEGKPDMVSRLLAAKANPSRQDARGMTPRDYASKIRTLWTAQETDVTFRLEKEYDEPEPDDEFVFKLERQLSEIQSRMANFARTEDMLRRAEEAQNIANSTSVKGNTYSNISGVQFNHIGSQINIGGHIHQGNVYFNSPGLNFDRK